MTAIAIGEGDTIAACFARRVAATPEAIAYREFDAAGGRWVEHTWRAMADKVERVRAALQAEDLAPGDRVAIMLRNGVDWVALDQGAYAAGLVVVPLYAEDRPDNVCYCVNDAGARVLFVGGDETFVRLEEICPQLQAERIVTMKPVKTKDPRVVSLEEWLGKARPRAGPRDAKADPLATVVYTSGTTGRPKGVMLSHQNILQNVKAALAIYDVYPHDLFLSFLPLSHMFERTVGYYLTMVAGAQVAFARSIPQLSEDFLAVRPTVIVAVPRIFERLHGAVQASLASAPPARRKLFDFAHRTGWSLFEWRQGRGPFKISFLLWPLLKVAVADKLLGRLGGRVRLCISGGAALNTNISRTFIGLGVPICQGYGLTETSPIVSANTLQRNDPASIGMPLPGVEVRFGENDALQVRGPNVMRGYWNNDAATAKVKDAEGWLDTGDQARSKDGFLYITGRLKEIIVLGNGEKVPPVDMELAIQLDPLFEQVMVIGEGRPFLSALVVLNAEQAAKAGALEDKALAARIGARLREFPGYAQIRRVAVIDEKWTVDNGLLTATLKQRRGPIQERYRERIEALYRRQPGQPA